MFILKIPQIRQMWNKFDNRMTLRHNCTDKFLI